MRRIRRRFRWRLAKAVKYRDNRAASSALSHIASLCNFFGNNAGHVEHQRQLEDIRLDIDRLIKQLDATNSISDPGETE